MDPQKQSIHRESQAAAIVLAVQQQVAVRVRDHFPRQ